MKLKKLSIYFMVTLLILNIVLLAYIIKKPKTITRFEEIDVERINVIEKDGALKMVISNQFRQHPGMMNGKTYDKRERPPGILFFNEEQDEIGGLTYYGNKNIGGNNFNLSVDQYKNDQVMQFIHFTNKKRDNRYGLLLSERDKNFTMDRLNKVFDSLDREGYNYPKKMEFLKSKNNGKPISTSRLFLGRNYNGETGLFIQDQYGKEQLRLYVGEDNQPKLEVLDSLGQSVKYNLIPEIK